MASISKSRDSIEEEVIILMQINHKNKSKEYEQKYSKILHEEIKSAAVNGLTKIHLKYKNERQQGIRQMNNVLQAHEELDTINSLYHSMLEEYLYTNNTSLIDFESMNVLAEEVIKKRSAVMMNEEAYMIIFGDKYGDRLHPNHWGKELDQDLLDSIHALQSNSIDTISMTEKDISNEGTISPCQMGPPKPWYKTPPQCAVSFPLQRKIYPRYDSATGAMYITQELSLIHISEPTRPY